MSNENAHVGRTPSINLFNTDINQLHSINSLRKSKSVRHDSRTLDSLSMNSASTIRSSFRASKYISDQVSRDEAEKTAELFENGCWIYKVQAHNIWKRNNNLQLRYCKIIDDVFEYAHNEKMQDTVNINLLQICSYNYPSSFLPKNYETKDTIDIITNERTYTFVGKNNLENSITFINYLALYCEKLLVLIQKPTDIKVIDTLYKQCIEQTMSVENIDSFIQSVDENEKWKLIVKYNKHLAKFQQNHSLDILIASLCHFEEQVPDDISQCINILQDADQNLLVDFYNRGGIQFILKNIEAYSMKNEPTDIEIDIITSLLMCIKIIITNQTGLIHLLTIDKALTSVIFSLLTFDIDCILLLLDIFEIIIATDKNITLDNENQYQNNNNVVFIPDDEVDTMSDKGHYELLSGTDLILQAIDNYRARAREQISFQSLAEALELSEDSELSYSILHFFNSLLNSMTQLEHRLILISIFISLDILGICNDTLITIKENPIFQEEFNTFVSILQRDKDNATIDGLYLGDMDSVLNQVIHDVNFGGNDDSFFTILRCMMCIPLDSSLGRSMWQDLAVQAQRIVQTSAFPKDNINDISFLKDLQEKKKKIEDQIIFNEVDKENSDKRLQEMYDLQDELDQLKLRYERQTERYVKEIEFIQKKLENSVSFIDLSKDEIYGEMFKDIDAGIQIDDICEFCQSNNLNPSILNNFSHIPYRVESKDIILDYPIPDHYYDEYDIKEDQISKESSKVPSSTHKEKKIVKVKKPVLHQIRSIEDPKFIKFFKMKKSGIPIPAIQANMKRSGLDEKIIELDKCPEIEEEISPLIDDPDYLNYFEQKKEGISIDRIKSAMKLEGLDENILDNNECPKIKNPLYDENAFEEVEEEIEVDVDDAISKVPSSKYSSLATKESLSSKASCIKSIVPLSTDIQNTQSIQSTSQESKDSEITSLKAEVIRDSNIKTTVPIETVNNNVPIKEQDIKEEVVLPPAKEKKCPAKQLMPFYWKAIPLDAVTNSIWNTLDDTHVQLNYEEIEEIFEAKPTKEVKLVIAQPEKAQKLYLDTKLQTKIEIPLSKLRLPCSLIKRALYRCDFITLNDKTILLLKDLLPNAESLSSISGVTSPEDLNIVDEFAYYMNSITDIQDRMTIFYYKVVLKGMIQDSIDFFVSVKKCFDYFIHDKVFHQFLEMILALGNYLNGTSVRGGAYGFDISSLNRLANTNGKGNVTILDYLLKSIDASSPDLLTVIESLKEFNKIAVLNKSSFTSEVQKHEKAMNLINKYRKAEPLDPEDKLSQLTEELYTSLVPLEEEFKKITNEAKESCTQCLTLFNFKGENDNIKEFVEDIISFDKILVDSNDKLKKKHEEEAQKKRDQERSEKRIKAKANATNKTIDPTTQTTKYHYTYLEKQEKSKQIVNQSTQNPTYMFGMNSQDNNVKNTPLNFMSMLKPISSNSNPSMIQEKDNASVTEGITSFYSQLPNDLSQIIKDNKQKASNIYSFTSTIQLPSTYKSSQIVNGQQDMSLNNSINPPPIPTTIPEEHPVLSSIPIVKKMISMKIRNSRTTIVSNQSSVSRNSANSQRVSSLTDQKTQQGKNSLLNRSDVITISDILDNTNNSSIQLNESDYKSDENKPTNLLSTIANTQSSLYNISVEQTHENNPIIKDANSLNSITEVSISSDSILNSGNQLKNLSNLSSNTFDPISIPLSPIDQVEIVPSTTTIFKKRPLLSRKIVPSKNSDNKQSENTTTNTTTTTYSQNTINTKNQVSTSIPVSQSNRASSIYAPRRSMLPRASLLTTEISSHVDLNNNAPIKNRNLYISPVLSPQLKSMSPRMRPLSPISRTCLSPVSSVKSDLYTPPLSRMTRLSVFPTTINEDNSPNDVSIDNEDEIDSFERNILGLKSPQPLSNLSNNNDNNDNDNNNDVPRKSIFRRLSRMPHEDVQQRPSTINGMQRVEATRRLTLRIQERRQALQEENYD